MPRNAKRVRISIVNPPNGCQPTTSLEHARRYVRRGVAEWEGGAIRFVQRKRQARAVNLDVVESVGDSGQSGFLRYPLPNMGSFGPRFPGLSRIA